MGSYKNIKDNQEYLRKEDKRKAESYQQPQIIVESMGMKVIIDTPETTFQGRCDIFL